MNVSRWLRVSDLAHAAQISVQQVRNYETYGLLPPVERSPHGYRRYTQHHIVALHTARQLIASYGWQRAQLIMQAIHENRRADAMAIIDDHHAELATTRQQLQQTLIALHALSAQRSMLTPARGSRRLRVGDAAKVVGVRVSALRFWEQQGLLQPSRHKESRYRQYDERQLRRLRIVALLRQANYDFATIRTTLDALDASQPERAVAAIEQRRADLAHRSWQCVTALAMLHEYVETFLGHEQQL